MWASIAVFAAVVLGLALAGAGALWSWLAARAWLVRRRPWVPALLAVGLAGAAAWFASQPEFEGDLTRLRTLLGGRAEAERRTIAHQVFAAYRRTPPESWMSLFERGRAFEPVVHEAAGAFAVDPEVLAGVAAAESAFAPRDSADGGRGLFQITVTPEAAAQAARAALAIDAVDPRRPRDNAYLAAATLRAYLDEMHGDLFLALLAYNVGPRNGGLRAIMERYGARDFITVQPYLQNLPRDYPIRVLSATLAYRLWRRDGRLPRYEEGDNAVRIQRLGVPGLDLGEF